MVLKEIKLRNFRNYENQSINFNNKFNFIFGNNGHGKTNILEAISFITFGKSFLGSPEQDCIKLENDAFYTRGIFENDIKSNFIISVDYDLNLRRKSIHLNKEKVSGFSSDVFGKFPVVFFSPHSLNITYGNPSERRRFFDILISQTNRLYLDYLKELNRILKQKNALLKAYTFEKAYSATDFRNLYNSFNEKLISVSVEITMRRFDFLGEFKKYFENNFKNLINTGDYPLINYFSEILKTDDELNLEKGLLLENYSSAIKNKEQEEIARGVSLIGPHRDDYIFKLNKENIFERKFDKIFELKNFASQGEHKTFVIALKLAEFYYIQDKTGTAPLLLLDDVLSELDSERVFKIISHLKDFGQIFLTSTDAEFLNNFKSIFEEDEISFFKVENGTVFE